MSVFKGKASSGVSFNLIDIELDEKMVAYPVPTSAIMSALRDVKDIDWSKIGEGDFSELLDTAPVAVARIIACSLKQNPENDEVLKEILDLSLEDMAEVIVAVKDATLKGKDPKDFFASLMQRLGINGIPNLEEIQEDKSSNLSMNSEIPSLKEVTEDQIYG